MQPTQSIIVYRNPMEKEIWESGAVPIIVLAALTFVVIFICMVKLFEVIFGKARVMYNANYSYGAGAVSLVLLYFAAKFFLLL